MDNRFDGRAVNLNLDSDMLLASKFAIVCVTLTRINHACMTSLLISAAHHAH